MREWIKRRAKLRKDGRLVLVTSVVFDAHVFDELCKHVTRDDGQRSELVNKALRGALATPGWIESALGQLSNTRPIAFEHAQKPPSSSSRIHARGGPDGPTTRRSPSSKSPSLPTPSPKRGPDTPRK